MANAGLTVKERLALLNNNNNNNSTNTNTKPATGGPHKPGPTVTPKPKPSPGTEAKPGVVGFRPVTPSKPAAPSHKPDTATSPHINHKPGTPPNKPVSSPDNKPVTANKPTTPGKPALASKPGVKPFTTSPSKPGSDDAGKTNGPDTPLFPKLRPVGSTPAGKVTPPVAGNKPAAGEPVAAAQAHSSQESGGSDSSSSSAEMRGKSANNVVTPLKPVSVQERLAAIRKKSSEIETMDPKFKPHNNSVSPTPKSTTTTTSKPSPLFPPSTSSAVSGASGHQTGSAGGPKPELPGVIKRSDIAKSLTQAADRVIRTKTPAAVNGSEEESRPRSHLFQRRCDGKKFRQVDVSTVISSEPAPAKPSALDSAVDIQPFLKAYAAAKEKKLEADGGKSSQMPTAAGEAEEEEDMEELYVEAESTSVTIRGRKGSVKRATTARVSFIPEYTEEEEDEELGTGSGAPQEPEEMYDDCQSAMETPKQEPPLEEPDEIYEPLDEQLPEEQETAEPEPIPPPLPSPNSRDKEKDEAAKRKDRAKEEANKKEEKERKKKEEELKKMRRKFGLNDGDEKVGDGVVKSNAGGGVFSKDLAVVKGETIAILRMDGNPAGKWLVQSEHGKIGYVSSNNIEISTPTIKHLMAGVKHETVASEEPDDMYEPLPDGDMDEIYEEL